MALAHASDTARLQILDAPLGEHVVGDGRGGATTTAHEGEVVAPGRDLEVGSSAPRSAPGRIAPVEGRVDGVGQRQGAVERR